MTQDSVELLKVHSAAYPASSEMSHICRSFRSGRAGHACGAKNEAMVDKGFSPEL